LLLSNESREVKVPIHAVSHKSDVRKVIRMEASFVLVGIGVVVLAICKRGAVFLSNKMLLVKHHSIELIGSLLPALYQAREMGQLIRLDKLVGKKGEDLLGTL
jgi:hypothetical protein